MKDLELYKYTITYYEVPNKWLNDDKQLVKKTILDVRETCVKHQDTIVSKNYSGPMEIAKIYIDDLQPLENHTYILDDLDRILMDAFDKNLEFAYRAEMQNPHLKGKYKDIWSYLKWCTDERMLIEEVNEVKTAIAEKDRIETIDGACDVAVIALNIAFKLFYDQKDGNHVEAMNATKEAFKRVTNSNLSKLYYNDEIKPQFDNDGKVKKGPFFVHPNFDDLF